MQKNYLIKTPQSIEYLDLIFNEIAKKHIIEGVTLTAASLISYFNIKGIRFDSRQMLVILNKLQADGVIAAKDENGRTLTTILVDTDLEITFQGILFRDTIHTYRQKYLQDTAENTRLANLENDQKFHRYALTVLTLIIAVGTLVAAVYYAIEVMKYFGWIPKN